jgi:hypothetical protein
VHAAVALVQGDVSDFDARPAAYPETGSPSMRKIKKGIQLFLKVIFARCHCLVLPDFWSVLAIKEWTPECMLTSDDEIT